MLGEEILNCGAVKLTYLKFANFTRLAQEMLRLFCGTHSSHFAVKERRVRGNEIEREMDMKRNGE